jgi:beta-1,4-mannosyl-glycoprotein beta-1,4-N-acetylglucosaminyltransferase
MTFSYLRVKGIVYAVLSYLRATPMVHKRTMKLYDNFLFNGEYIVQMRLTYMYKYVDKFFICEKRYTYQGKRKETLFIESRKDWFIPFLDKIIFLVDESEPNPVTWENEYVHRSYSKKYIQEYGEKDGDSYLLIVADADEVPNMEQLNRVKEELYEECKSGYIVLNQLEYYYNLHWFTHPSAAAFLLSDKLMKTDIDFKMCRGKQGDVSCEFDCGWHFAYFMIREEIRRKIESFSHTECNKEEFKTDEAIDSCLQKGKDLYNRPSMNECMRRKEPTPLDYPPEIYAFHIYIKGLQESKSK